MARPKIREIEMTAQAEAFLSGVEGAPLVSVPVEAVAGLVAKPVVNVAPAPTTTAVAEPKRTMVEPVVSAPTALEPETASAREPEKKWAAKFHLSTIDLIERRFHEYYTCGHERLSKRDIVETLLVDALGDDTRVHALLGSPPQAG